MKLLAASIALLALSILVHGWLTRTPRYAPTSLVGTPYSLDLQTGLATNSLR